MGYLVILFESKSSHGIQPLLYIQPCSIDVHTNRFIVTNKTKKGEKKKIKKKTNKKKTQKKKRKRNEYYLTNSSTFKTGLWKLHTMYSNYSQLKSLETKFIKRLLFSNR